MLNDEGRRKNDKKGNLKARKEEGPGAMNDEG